MQFGRWKTVLILLACVFLIVCALPNFIQTKFLPSALNHKVNYGLDLKGGVQLLLKVDFEAYAAEQLNITSELLRKSLRKARVGYTELRSDGTKIVFNLRNRDDEKAIKSLVSKIDGDLMVKSAESRVEVSYSESKVERLLEGLIDQTVEIIRHRIDESGTLEPSIQRQGSSGILLQVPGLREPGELKRLLGTTAKLTFHMVDEEASVEQALKGVVPYGDRLVLGDSDKSGQKIWYLIKDKASLTGDTLINAQLYNSTSPMVAFNFNTLGAKIFADVTTKNTGKRLAIVLDDKIISAPVINEPILSGAGTISGNFTVSSANELALLLRAGALPAPLKIAEEKVVGPNLGEDSIEFGKKSGLVAIASITVLMIALYGLFGVFASIALLVNLGAILTSMGFLNATLTMPGIAGIVLTMGMAVDTNVLIFERIKEEIKIKSTVQYAIKQGFHQAFATILDSNLTTLVAAFFLYAFGSGIIRGFAVTLTIGILSSMFTAITLTKLLIYCWIDFKAPTK